MHARWMTLFIVMFGPVFGSGEAVRAEIRSDLRERSYLVSGNTAKDVAAFMRRRPFRGDYGPAIANIRPRYAFTFKTEQHDNHCRVHRFQLTIDFTMTLPKARNRKAFDRRTLSAWRSLRGFTRRHELGHRKIYLDCARRVERTVLKARSRHCSGMGWTIRKILNESRKTCRQRHLAFDRREIRRLKHHRFFALARRQRARDRAESARRTGPGPSSARNGRLLFFVAE